jgi:predicted esterase
VKRTYFTGDLPDLRISPPKGFFWAYQQESREYRIMSAMLKLTTGLRVATFQGSYEGTAFLVDGVRGRPPDPLADVADVPALDLRAGDDAKKRYFLIGAGEKAKAPPEGYRVLIVLPGGDGSADFHPFIRRIYKNVLNERWLVAQLVAPKWDEDQFQRVVWPTAGLNYPAAQFTTEEFIQAVLANVQAKVKVDPKRVFLLGWSSGGPPCYAMAVRKESPVTGALIAMSVFKPEQIPALENAKGRAFYLLQSPDDKVTPIRFAEAAERTLVAAGAKVRLKCYRGGHGWRGDVWGMIGEGIKWLDQQAAR